MNDKEKMELFNKTQEMINLNELKSFTDAAYVGWPQDFYGRLVAERMVQEILSLNKLSARADYDHFKKKALASLAEEGIEIEEEEK